MSRNALCLLALGAQMASVQVDAAGSVLVPAYIYPLTETTWQPLYNQVEAYPNVQFNVIINPSSGPGADVLPDTSYAREIVKLNGYRNVRLVGYVAVNYTNKDISTVEAQVSKYANWPAASTNPTLSVSGIFFDEAPSADAAAEISYMRTAASYAHSLVANATAPNLGASPYVVINPGYPPARAYLVDDDDADGATTGAAPDLSLVYEQSYAAWTANEANINGLILALDVDAEKLAVMLHTVPSAELGCSGVQKLADELVNTTRVQTLWATDDADYQTWPGEGLWARLLGAIDGGAAC